MKKSIRIISFLVVCILLCGVLMACAAPAASDGAKTASAEGRWDVSSITDENGTTEGEALTAEMGEVYYEFQSGGKFVAGAAGLEALGVWEQDGASVKFEIDGTSSTGVIDGDTLTIEANGATSVFTRK